MLKDFQKMIFNFTVKYLGWLKDIPFLPMIFESLLILHSYLFNRDILKSIEKIEEEVTKWPGISKLNHRYGGIQFDYDGKEIGHIHGHGLLDILFSKAIRKNSFVKIK